MTRMRLILDSATAAEAEQFIYAYQRSIPNRGLTWEEPTVAMMGKWSVTLPYVSVEVAANVMRDFTAQQWATPAAYDVTRRPCAACGAEVGEPCGPLCIGLAAAQDESERLMLLAGEAPSDEEAERLIAEATAVVMCRDPRHETPCRAECSQDGDTPVNV